MLSQRCLDRLPSRPFFIPDILYRKHYLSVHIFGCKTYANLCQNETKNSRNMDSAVAGGNDGIMMWAMIEARDLNLQARKPCEKPRFGLSSWTRFDPLEQSA